MKKYISSTILLSGLLIFASCGEAPTDETVEGQTSEENACTEENDFFLQIEKYGYRYDTTYTYNGDFDVVRTEWTQLNDSSANLSLFNYELGAASSNDNLEVRVAFHTKNGKAIEPGIYPYMDYNGDYWCKTSIESPQGSVYFNWNMGMPEQGHVELIHADKDEACGKFALSVDKQNMTNIGHVVLNGTFKTK